VLVVLWSKFLVPSSISGLVAAAWYTDYRLPMPSWPVAFRKNNFEVVAQSTGLNNAIRPQMEQILSEYKPSWFYIQQALVIVHSCMVPAPHPLKYERVNAIAKTKTAGVLTYDIVRAATPTKKALLIVPGVCGNSQEAYIMHLADEARLNGFNVLIINPTAPATVGEEFD